MKTIGRKSQKQNMIPKWSLNDYDTQMSNLMEHTMYNSLEPTPKYKDNGLKRNGFSTSKHEETT